MFLEISISMISLVVAGLLFCMGPRNSCIAATFLISFDLVQVNISQIKQDARRINISPVNESVTFNAGVTLFFTSHNYSYFS